MEPLIKCEHVDLGYENQDAVIPPLRDYLRREYL